MAVLHSRVDTNLLQFAFKPNHRGPQKKGEIQMFKKRLFITQEMQRCAPDLVLNVYCALP